MLVDINNILLMQLCISGPSQLPCNNLDYLLLFCFVSYNFFSNSYFDIFIMYVYIFRKETTPKIIKIILTYCTIRVRPRQIKIYVKCEENKFLIILANIFIFYTDSWFATFETGVLGILRWEIKGLFLDLSIIFLCHQ